jgi:hypothetical protein
MRIQHPRKTPVRRYRHTRFDCYVPVSSIHHRKGRVAGNPAARQFIRLDRSAVRRARGHAHEAGRPQCLSSAVSLSKAQLSQSSTAKLENRRRYALAAIRRRRAGEQENGVGTADTTTLCRVATSGFAASPPQHPKSLAALRRWASGVISIRLYALPSRYGATARGCLPLSYARVLGWDRRLNTCVQLSAGWLFGATRWLPD